MNRIACSLTALSLASILSFAAEQPDVTMVTATDQSVANGMVSASRVVATENGWLVVHRTDATMNPGPVVAYAPLRAGENLDVTAILQEPVVAGDMLMLKIHAETGGISTGVFEYTLGAIEDGPIRPNGEMVMTVITVQSSATVRDETQPISTLGSIWNAGARG